MHGVFHALSVSCIECCIAHHLHAVSGLTDDLIEKGKDIKSISEIEQNGDQFKVTVTTGSKVMTNSFTIGQEAEMETLTGEKTKVLLCSVYERLIALIIMLSFVF